MNMFGHDHESDHVESILATNLFHRFQKQVARTSRSQKGLASITTGGDEAKIAPPIVPAQRTAEKIRLRHAI